jgi:hypothetical protein
LQKFFSKRFPGFTKTTTSQAAEIGRLGIYGLFFAADIGRLGAKGLNQVYSQPVSGGNK